MPSRIFSAVFLAALFGCMYVTAADAQNKEGFGAVTGRVLCSDTQQPARLAHVVLQPAMDPDSLLLKKDDHGYHREGIFNLETVSLDGSFTIPSVPQGRYYVIAEQDGYISPLALFTRAQLNDPDEALQKKIARYMSILSVTAGHTTQTEVTLIRGAVITGMVRFEDGSPGINVGVQLMQRDDKGDWQTVRTQRLASHPVSYTDDQGVYRFSGLPGGEYIVRANVELNKVILDHIFGNGSTYLGDGYHLRVYPGDAFRARDAKPVKIEEGENATSVDVDIPLSKLYTLSGTVVRPDSNAPVNQAHLTLVFADTDEELTSTEVDADDGSFHFDFVPGGNYVLRVTRIANVERTEVPACEHCIPPTETKVRMLAKFGDVTQPIQLTSDQSAFLVQANPSTKAVASSGIQ